MSADLQIESSGAIVRRRIPPTPTADTYVQIRCCLDSALREILGAWVVCFAIATACFGYLAAAVPTGTGPTEALIGFNRAATVTSDSDRVVHADRHGRC